MRKKTGILLLIALLLLCGCTAPESRRKTIEYDFSLVLPVEERASQTKEFFATMRLTVDEASRTVQRAYLDYTKPMKMGSIPFYELRLEAFERDLQGLLEGVPFSVFAALPPPMSYSQTDFSAYRERFELFSGATLTASLYLYAVRQALEANGYL